MSGQIVERVNAYFGHRQIDDIRLMQGAITRAAVRAPIPKPAPEAVAPWPAPRWREVQDPDLRAALARLGGAHRHPSDRAPRCAAGRAGDAVLLARLAGPVR